ncbi:uncharacterized protein METZ01_LOCUS62381 [marine metagenome]|uniref:Uncharacterized protein n=1 Tax=marine metagenome TaxID=408172 RepID=A0A381T4H9_9ZZZZ
MPSTGALGNRSLKPYPVAANMNNAVRINAEEHKYWNSDSVDYWVSQKPGRRVTG